MQAIVFDFIDVIRLHDKIRCANTDFPVDILYAEQKSQLYQM